MSAHLQLAQTLTPAAQQRRQREHAARMQAQADCLEHHRALAERLAQMSLEERRVCYGLPPAPVRRMKTLPGMKTLAHAMQGRMGRHVAARADAQWTQTLRGHMSDHAHEPVPELPRVITAAWRALWLTGRSLALAFGGRAAA